MDIPFWTVAIGSELREFPEETCLMDTWKFLNEKLPNQEERIAVVFEDQHAYRVGELWESSLFYALAETPQKLAAYLRLCQFGNDSEG